MICEALCEIKIKSNDEIQTIPAGNMFETLDITTAYSLVRSSKIKILSINIDTSVKQSPPCPPCPQAQYYQWFHDADMEKPKSAMSASDEGADKTWKNPAPPKNTNGWDVETQKLIGWFLTLTPPTEPFYLQAHTHVASPGKFFESLLRDIKAGPKGPRARLGTLKSDLRSLQLKFQGSGLNRISSK
jgi:hypothetical protein